jgi:beta-lactamase class A/alkylated DNA repair dioxygenase AlkB
VAAGISIAATSSDVLPNGFIYTPDLLTGDEERALLAELASLPFEPVEFRGYTAKRRAIHYGVGYDFADRAVTPAPPMPDFLSTIRARAAATASESPDTFTEALVMEYPPGAVIGWHRDAPKFGPTVLGISIGSAARMRFKRVNSDGKLERASIVLEPRSAYAMKDEARSTWQHSIPAVSALRYSITFRSVLLSLLLLFLVASPAAAQKPDVAPLETTLRKIAGAARGRVGVALIHLESGTTIDVRGHERFPMASVVKLPIAIEVLKQVAEGRLTLERAVWLDASDIRPCCAIERRHPKGGASRTVRELLELAIIESDNTAADALLKLVGGADVVERRLRAMGFSLINVDRTEGQLLLDMAGVTNAPPPEQWTIDLQRKLVAEVDRESLNKGRARYLTDERDTATPYETAQLLGRLQLGDLLPQAETDVLIGYLLQTKTGPRRLKGRLPPETPVAHKTGTTAVVINDVGIITLPPDSKIAGRVVLAVYIADGASIAAMERTAAQIGAATFEFFTGRTIPQRPAQRRRRR